MVKSGFAKRILARFDALSYRDYRLVFFASTISVTGNWMEIVLRNWLVYQISGSAFILGLSNLVHWLPFLVLSPLAGVFVDRWDKRLIMILAQIVLTLVTFLLGLLTIIGKIEVWHVILLVLIHGIAEAFDNPARQSLISDLVKRETVMNAVSLSSAVYFTARLLGPAIGGLLISTSGIGAGFIINAATFIPYILVLPFIHTAPTAQGIKQKKVWQSFKEGLEYIFTNKATLAVLVLVGLTSIFSISYMTLLPIFAEEVLFIGPQGLGFLNSAIGLGGILGALFLAYYSVQIRQKGLFICLAAASFGLFLLLFSFSRLYWFSLLCLTLAGSSNVVFNSGSNATLQTGCPSELRGRIMGVFTMTSLGTNVLGSLIVGSLGELLGAPLGLAISAFMSILVVTGVYFFIPSIHILNKNEYQNEEGC